MHLHLEKKVVYLLGVFHKYMHSFVELLDHYSQKSCIGLLANCKIQLKKGHNKQMQIKTDL